MRGEVDSPLLFLNRAAAFGVRRLAAAFVAGQNRKAGASSRTPKRAVRARGSDIRIVSAVSPPAAPDFSTTSAIPDQIGVDSDRRHSPPVQNLPARDSDMTNVRFLGEIPRISSHPKDSLINTTSIKGCSVSLRWRLVRLVLNRTMSRCGVDKHD